jgi:hypothetical protein
MPTPQDTQIVIFGSGLEFYSWWRGMSASWDLRAPEAPDDWCWTVKVSEPNGGGVRTALVTHSVLMGAMRTIAQGGGRRFVTEECRSQCRAFLDDPEESDFDAALADEVLQVATLGEVVYG